MRRYSLISLQYSQALLILCFVPSSPSWADDTEASPTITNQQPQIADQSSSPLNSLSISHTLLFHGPPEVFTQQLIEHTFQQNVTMTDNDVTITFVSQIGNHNNIKEPENTISVLVGSPLSTSKFGIIYPITMRSSIAILTSDFEKRFLRYLEVIDDRLTAISERVLNIPKRELEQLNISIKNYQQQILAITAQQKEFLSKDISIPPVEVLIKIMIEIDGELLRREIELILVSMKANHAHRIVERSDDKIGDQPRDANAIKIIEFQKTLTQAISDRNAIEKKLGPNSKEVNELDSRIKELLTDFRNAHIDNINKHEAATKFQEYVDAMEDNKSAVKSLTAKRTEVERQRIKAIERDTVLHFFNEELNARRMQISKATERIAEIEQSILSSFPSSDSITVLNYIVPLDSPLGGK